VRDGSGRRVAIRRIVFVTDEQALAPQADVTLGMEGWETTWIATLQEARAALRQERRALFVVDLSLKNAAMPLLEELALALARTAIVALTASRLDRILAQRFGATVVEKPLTMSALVAGIRACVARPA